MKLPRFVTLILVAAVVLTACIAAPAPSQAPSLPPTLSPLPTSTETPKPSVTPAPSSTITPSITPSSTSTPTASPSPTPSVTPRPSFAGFKVDYADYTNYGLLLAMRVPGIKENYRLDVSGIAYKCNLYPNLPDRIFCYGPQLPPYSQVKLSFLPVNGGTDPVYQVDYLIMPFKAPTVDPRTIVAANPLTCPVRGVNVSCETEYRILGDGYCIVATCVDTCGYYYSVQTCPPDMTLQGIYIFTGTPPFPAPPDASR